MRPRGQWYQHDETGRFCQPDDGLPPSPRWHPCPEPPVVSIAQATEAQPWRDLAATLEAAGVEPIPEAAIAEMAEDIAADMYSATVGGTEDRYTIARLVMTLLEGVDGCGRSIRDWQDAIREAVIDGSGAPPEAIDGAGSDSGDPLDFTLAEIGQGFGWLDETLNRPDPPGKGRHTGIAAQWCPECGTCTCKEPRWRAENYDPDCPLHAASSPHAAA